jgi:hypothetical protein
MADPVADLERPTDDRPPIQHTTNKITPADHWDHILARWGVNRSGHRVEPGLYALKNPNAGSPVLVTANYTLSFDALRSALPGIDGYILVLDTQGINVWCAAGKGTFGTDELVRRIEATALHDVVDHRVLILPQLGAPGVSAHEVKRRSGFRVEYGPIRAADLPQYLQTRRATPEMRRVHFGLRDRLVLIPVEWVHVLLPMLVATLLAYFLGGTLASTAVLAAVLAGTVAFPILLPWIPTREFSSKGFILGGLAALPFALVAWFQHLGTPWWVRIGWTLAYLLAMPPVTAYLALNFTGSTTFTSRTGVRREILSYIPIMAATFGAGIVLTLALGVMRWIG